MKVKLLVQIGIVFGICLLGELIAKLLPFVFPSSVISMILLFLLLLSGLLKVAFFFIPSGVALIEQMDVLKGKILPLLAICLITTILTFMVSAFTIRLVTAWQKRLSKEEK